MLWIIVTLLLAVILWKTRILYISAWHIVLFRIGIRLAQFSHWLQFDKLELKYLTNTLHHVNIIIDIYKYLDADYSLFAKCRDMIIDMRSRLMDMII